MSTVNQNQLSATVSTSGNETLSVEGSGSFCGFTICATGLTEDATITACLRGPGDVAAPLPYTATANADGACALTFRLSAPFNRGISVVVAGNSDNAQILVSMYENVLYLHRLGSAR